MKLIATSIGSYPPILNASKEMSIRRAIHEQIEAGMDLLVSGNFGSDNNNIFTLKNIGVQTRSTKYILIDKVKPPDKPITIDDYLLARKFGDGYAVKANLTGPTFLAESALLQLGSPYKSRNDPKLVIDIARALAQEARWLTENGAEYIQIDEPSFPYGVNLDVALEALQIITAHIKYPILHACGDISYITHKLLTAPVDILSIEGRYIKDLSRKDLIKNNKKIAYGCVPVNMRKNGSVRQISNEVISAMETLGTDSVWGITPNCGLRLVESDPISRRRRLAFGKMKLVAETAHTIEKVLGSSQNAS